MNDWIGSSRLAVRAGAGAGKTYMLVQRYLHHVREHGLSPLEVVAVTFTDAAAAELRSRIRAGMVDAFGEDDARVAELEAARIGTFHSLAASICRAHSEQAEVPADFAVLDDVLGPIWTLDRLDLALDSLPVARYRRIPFSRMRESLRELIRDPIAAEQSLRRRARDWRKAVEAARSEAAGRLLGLDNWRDGRDGLAHESGSFGDRLAVIRATMLGAMATFEADTTRVESLTAIDEIRLSGGRQPKGSEGLICAIKAVRGAVRSSLQEGLVDLAIGPADVEMIRAISDLRRACRQVQGILARDKRRERVLDYADLEVHALKALEHDSVRAFYHLRWKAFLVDEYQDTNPVQAKMLDLLIGADARQVIVGDENQSIYGFRRAAPHLFGERSDAVLAEGGRCETLPFNYRSHDALVGSFNTAFSAMFGNGYAPQQAPRKSPCGDRPALERFFVSTADGADECGTEQRRRCEAMRIARMLFDMHASGATVHDRKTGDVRPVRWGDMAILTRTWRGLDPIAEALGALGAPYVHAGGGSLMTTREARDGYALLRFLAEPTDNLALAAVLKGPLFALSDRDLFDLRQLAGDKGAWWTALTHASAADRHAFAADLLGRLLDLSRSRPPSRILHIADNEAGLSAILSALPGGARRAADWAGFCDLVRMLERGECDLFGLTRVLRRLTLIGPSGELEVIVARPAIEPGDAIELLSIHRAKGLEWPVVVLADTTADASKDSSWLRFDPAFGAATKALDAAPSGDDDESPGDGGARPPCLFRLLDQARKRADAAELRRMAYVACTRARDILIVTSAHEPSDKVGRLSACLDLPLEAAGAAFADWPFDVADAEPPIPRSTPHEVPLPRICIGAIQAPPRALPVTAIEEYRQCPKRFRYTFVDGHPGIGEGSSISGRVGTLVHVAIEHAIFESIDLQRFDRSLASTHVERALTMANRFRDAQVYAPYRLAQTRHEVPVSRYLDGVTLSGRIDLLGPDFVLDFKTGRERAAEAHALQLWLYGEATGKSELAIAYLPDGSLRRWGRDDVAATGAHVREILASIGKMHYDPTPSAAVCSSCRYRRLCDEYTPAPDASEGSVDSEEGW